MLAYVSVARSFALYLRLFLARFVYFRSPLLRVLFTSLAWCAGNIKCNFAQRILRGYSDPDGVSRSTFSVLATFVEYARTQSCHFYFRQRFRFFVGRYRKIFVASLPRCSRSRAICLQQEQYFEDFPSLLCPWALKYSSKHFILFLNFCMSKNCVSFSIQNCCF